MKIDNEENLQKYVTMSWILLEYEVIYFLSSSTYVDESWIELRKISDEQYDQKLEAYKELGNILGRNTVRPVGCDKASGAVKLVLSKFLAPMLEYDRIPHVWPDEETETENELTLRTYLEVEMEDSQLEFMLSS